ncbi:MAG TPA: histidine--tRNA ligase, partial [Cellulomonadaceae bacterium]|nr:histidine--tRNA ligase [Cellulomonadaceae bacterium]
VFALHGFAEIETRAIEPLSRLRGDSDAAKEIYALRRVLADADDADSGMGLHFDLTVPFARYVEEFSGRLTFPFRRYQIQKVWRGERPQEGRFREFYQADIDVVGAGELPYHVEVELPLVMAEALGALPIPPVRILVNNRKVAEGFYRGIGLDDVDAVLRSIDKLDKIGPDGVASLLVAEIGASADQAAACLALAGITGDDARVAEDVVRLAKEHGARSDLLDVGLAELVALLEAAAELAPGVLVADLRIARGLDYYTGSVYETVLVGHESLGSICSGGRYDELAADGANTYPGVGLSIGVSRLVSRLLGENLVSASRSVPSAVLVAVTSEQTRAASTRVAASLRARGIPVEVAPNAAKFGKQIRHADRRGIPFVWFPGVDGAADEVKDIRSGDQVPADAAAWEPPSADWYPTVTRIDV